MLATNFVSQTEDPHSNFMVSPQDYHERLEEVRRSDVHSMLFTGKICQVKLGVTSKVDENPYHNPASDEQSIYMEFKKMKVQSIPQFALE